MTEQTKWCSAGQHEVDVDDFYKRGSRLQPNCKTCHNKVTKEWYKQNKTSHLANTKQDIKNKRDVLSKWKSANGCALCGETHPRCLEFHHIDPKGKDFQLGNSFSRVGITKLVEEIRKCILLCANCHRKVHDGVLSFSDDQRVSESQLIDLQQNISEM